MLDCRLKIVKGLSSSVYACHSHAVTIRIVTALSLSCITCGHLFTGRAGVIGYI